MKIFSVACVALIAAFSFSQRPLEGKGKSDAGNLPEILQAAAAKAKKLRFSGTRIVSSVKAGKVETHEEYITKDGSKLRIEFSGKSPFTGQIILETGTERLHYFPDRNEVRQSPSSGRRQFDISRIIRMARGGKPKFSVSDGGSIAGFKVSKVQIQDNMGNRLGEFYVDTNSGMTLKRVLFDPSGAMMASYEFKSVSLNPVLSPGAFKFNHKGAKVIRPVDDLKSAADQLKLPALGIQSKLGFTLEGASVRSIKGNQTLVQVYVKDDLRITLFITRSEIGRDGRMFGGREISSYQWSVSGVNCMLVGAESEAKLKVLSGNVVEISR